MENVITREILLSRGFVQSEYAKRFFSKEYKDVEVLLEDYMDSSGHWDLRMTLPYTIEIIGREVEVPVTYYFPSIKIVRELDALEMLLTDKYK